MKERMESFNEVGGGGVREKIEPFLELDLPEGWERELRDTSGKGARFESVCFEYSNRFYEVNPTRHFYAEYFGSFDDYLVGQLYWDDLDDALRYCKELLEAKKEEVEKEKFMKTAGEVKGVGEKTVDKLYEKFGTLEEFMEAPLSEIEDALHGVSPKLVKLVAKEKAGVISHKEYYRKLRKLQKELEKGG
nr:hypothetical protein [uncultured bacterium]